MVMTMIQGNEIDEQNTCDKKMRKSIVLVDQ